MDSVISCIYCKLFGESLETKFHKHLKEYQIGYSTEDNQDEVTRRFHEFKNKEELINAINQRQQYYYSNKYINVKIPNWKQKSFTLGHNMFSTWTHDEYVEQFELSVLQRYSNKIFDAFEG